MGTGCIGSNFWIPNACMGGDVRKTRALNDLCRLAGVKFLNRERDNLSFSKVGQPVLRIENGKADETIGKATEIYQLGNSTPSVGSIKVYIDRAQKRGEEVYLVDRGATAFVVFVKPDAVH